MSSASAALTLVLTAGLILAKGRPLPALRRAAALAVALLAALVSGLGTFIPGLHPGGSHLTTFGFLGAALALALLAAPVGRAWWVRQLAALAALVPLFVGGVVLFSYAAGIPLLYETEATPLSLPTALALFFLGHGLLAREGSVLRLTARGMLLSNAVLQVFV